MTWEQTLTAAMILGRLLETGDEERATEWLEVFSVDELNDLKSRCDQLADLAYRERQRKLHE
jgi:hypothetical protein